MCEKSLPVFATGKVFTDVFPEYVTTEVDHFILWIDLADELAVFTLVAGQFFMLRKKGSVHLLGRPISAYGPVRRFHCPQTDEPRALLGFLILEKGGGTRELSLLNRGDEVEILGPLGNGFPLPDASDRVCLISGGVGIAPIASLAMSLPEESYDFYACFKDRSYGFPKEFLKIATESGIEGKRGMLPAILDAETLKRHDYTIVYACGPMPMLKYVQSICKKVGVKSYFSMENRMACGVGACLGCTIRTTEGNKRCCKDGPVFPGEILIFDDAPKISSRISYDPDEATSPDLLVEIAGVEFKNPVIAASGTFGYGTEYDGLVDPGLLGGVCSKGLTLQPKVGNDGIRIHELSCVGMMNSIGLENPGIEHFIEHELPLMLKSDTVSIVNLSGSSLETYVEGAKLLDKTAVDMIELNISCPNVKAGGMAFGMRPKAAEKVTRAVREVTGKPLIVKLTPNAPNLVKVALAVREAGADVISLVSTFQALAIDIETGKPVFNNVCAGYSGLGIKPIALRMVYDVAKAVRKNDPDYPIIGLGGITTWQDAVEFIMAGATAIQVGTATFNNPKAMLEIVDGIRDYMKLKGFKSLADFRGIVT